MSNDLDRGRERQLTVGDIMCQKVATIPASSTMHCAARVLAGQSIGGAPVVDDEGRCVGILSAADFVRYEVDRVGDAVDVTQCNTPPKREYVPWNSVRRYMTTAVQTVSSNTPLVKACEIMCGEHIHRLLVLGEHGAPVGIVSTLDIVAALVRLAKEIAAHQPDNASKKHEQVH